MTQQDFRLPAEPREKYDTHRARLGLAPAVVRLEYSSQERSDGWLRAASADGAVQHSQRLGDFIAAIPCFTPHAALATETGSCLAGAVKPGQRVLTRDHGLQEVRWVGRRGFGWRELGLNPVLRPVRIAAGALGDGVPSADLLVSPNHRILTALPGQALTDSTERLWQARNLLGRAGIAQAECRAVDYIQILLDRHELVLADGCWSESFLPTGARLAALSVAARDALAARVPGVASEAPPAFCLVRPEAVTGG